MAANSIKIIPGKLFIIREYAPSQRVISSRKIMPFSRFNWPWNIGLLFPLSLRIFSITYIQTRSFHAIKAFDRIVYFRKWGS